MQNVTQPIFGHVTIKDGVLTFVPSDGSHPMTAKVSAGGGVMGLEGSTPMDPNGPYKGHVMGLSGGDAMEKPNE